MSYIEVTNLKKTIKDVLILDIPKLTLEKGTCYGFVGRNGSGKSMLFKSICGYINFDGEIFVDGQQIGKNQTFLQNAGVIIENAEFIPNLTGFENLSILAKIKNKIGSDDVKAILKTVGLVNEHRKDASKSVSKYSLGMKQRLRLAQALMEDDALLILDEPMNGLDNDGVEDIRKLLLAEKEKGKTILLASHNRDDIDILCDFVYEMDKGEIISESRGVVDEL